MRPLHSLTHRHWQAVKPNVGVVLVCYPRWHGEAHYYFAPALGGSSVFRDITSDQLGAIGPCTTPEQALAVIGEMR